MKRRMRGGILCHVGQAEMVNVAGVCSPSTNDVGHHENESTETGHTSPWLNHSRGSPMKKRVFYFGQVQLWPGST